MNSGDPINKKNSKAAFLPEPAGLFGLAIFWTLFLLSGQKSLMCGDTLWHIKVGQVMLDSGQILTHDVFSHTVANKAWTAHEWLSEVFMAFCYNLGGLPGVTLVFFVIVSISMALLFKASQKLSNEWSAFCAITIAAAFAQIHLLARPHIFTWLFGSIFLYLLINQDRKLWVLPILTAIWGNLHGGVLIGIVLQGAFLSGSFLDACSEKSFKDWRHHWPKIRQPFYIFLLSLLALGCNPFGYSLLWFPFKVTAEVFSQNIAEWKAPDLQEMWYVRVWLIMLAALIASQGRRLSWVWRLLLVFFVYQALGHVRHLSIAAMFLAPWTAMSISELFKRTNLQKPKGDEVALSPYSGPLLIGVSFLILSSFSISQPAWWQNFTAKSFALPDRYTQGAISYLKEHGYPGEHLLNEYSWGGFLLFDLDPPPKVFIDGRADMYGEKVFSDYAKLTYIHPDMDDLLIEYKIDWILYPKDSFLIRYMSTKPEWEKVYGDDEISILALKR
jgi:hypothetical protein